MLNAPPPSWVAESSPAARRPLVPAVERLAAPLRECARTLASAASLVPFEDLYAPKRQDLGFSLPEQDRGWRTAWALIGQWLCAATAKPASDASTIGEAHRWFWRDAPAAFAPTPDLLLPSVLADRPSRQLRALMPYLLDPLAAGTRRDVIKSPDLSDQRQFRKATGVYFTPGDVAYAMVLKLISSGETPAQSWLDPANGSGVFLRAALAACAATSGSVPLLYGVDVNPMAAEATAFVLTAEDCMLRPDGPPPWVRWHDFRSRLATGDTLMLAGLSPSAHQIYAFASPTATTKVLGAEEPWYLSTAFPELVAGVDRVATNPPYARLGAHPHAAQMESLHPVTGKARRDISPIFTEVALRLLAADGALSVVTPLSHVASTQAPFPGLRRVLAARGSLELLSFDRMPDALFGDDVKTRNAIITLHTALPGVLVASGLRRWTSRNRSEALTDVPVISLKGFVGASDLVPKIGTAWERSLYMQMSGSTVKFGAWLAERKTASLNDPSLEIGGTDVISLGPTAYNFLNVVREPRRAVFDGHDAVNPVHMLRFLDDRLASAAYAVLCSRHAFWLWHVTGDGFHVTSRFIDSVPLPARDSPEVERLAVLGDSLWKVAAQRPALSVNAGRTSVAYPAWVQSAHIDAVDAVCSAVLGLDAGGDLKRWYDSLVLVHEEDRRSQVLRKKQA